MLCVERSDASGSDNASGDYLSSAESDTDPFASDDSLSAEENVELDYVLEDLLEDVQIDPEAGARVRQFSDDPKALILALLVNYAAKEKIAYKKMDKLMRLLIIFFDALKQNGHLQEESRNMFDGFPTTIRTALRNMKRWEPRDLFRVYVACERNHMTPKEQVVQDGKKVSDDAALCSGRQRDGNRCLLPLLELRKPLGIIPRYKPKRQAPFQGIIRPLSKLLLRPSFVDAILQSKQRTSVDPSQNVLSDGLRYKAFQDIGFLDEVFDERDQQWKPSAEVPGKPPLNLLVLAAIDWYVSKWPAYSWHESC